MLGRFVSPRARPGSMLNHYDIAYYLGLGLSAPHAAKLETFYRNTMAASAARQ